MDIIKEEKKQNNVPTHMYNRLKNLYMSNDFNTFSIKSAFVNCVVDYMLSNATHDSKPIYIINGNTTYITWTEYNCFRIIQVDPRINIRCSEFVDSVFDKLIIRNCMFSSEIEFGYQTPNAKKSQYFLMRIYSNVSDTDYGYYEYKTISTKVCCNYSHYDHKPVFEVISYMCYRNDNKYTLQVSNHVMHESQWYIIHKPAIDVRCCDCYNINDIIDQCSDIFDFYTMEFIICKLTKLPVNLNKLLYEILTD